MRKGIRKTAAYIMAVMIAGGISNAIMQTNFNVKSDAIVSAEEKSNVQAGPTLTANIKEQKKYLPGDTFVMQIMVTDNENGYNGLLSNISIDPSVLEIVEWSEGDPDEEHYSKTRQKINTSCLYVKNELEEVIAVNQLYFDEEAENFTGDNVFSTITFKIKDTAKTGTYKIDIAPSETIFTRGNRVVKTDEKVIVIEPKYVGAEIEISGNENTVTDVTYTTNTVTDTSEAASDVSKADDSDFTGDVNGDGVINAEDMMLLTKCILGMKNVSDYPGADVNKDNKVTVIDLARLKNIIIEQ